MFYLSIDDSPIHRVNAGLQRLRIFDTLGHFRDGLESLSAKESEDQCCQGDNKSKGFGNVS